MTVATAPTAPAERTFTDRLLAAVPLLSIFLWLCIVYAIEAWAHGTPWLFGDELELTQLSRSIADTGHAARRGEPHSFDSLWTYVTRAGLAHRRPAHGLCDREVHRRLRHDGDGIPGVHARAPRRRPPARAVRRCRGCGDPVARVLVDDRRGAARVSVLDALPLADPPRADPAEPLVDRRRRRSRA